MSMHTIRVVYDPTTRRISLAQNSGNYGGATTDDNSVNIIVTGIVPDGTNFKARVDFGVQVRTDTHVYNHPFVLLEQDNDEWSCVIPNPILRAAGQARCRLPIQLVIANDDYVINSRNTITLEVTQAIDGEDDGGEIPPYDVPEWVIPEGQTVYEEDVHLVEVEYTPATRTLTVSNEGSKYGGSTIDCQSVAIQVTGIVPVGNDFSVRVDFAMPVEVEKGTYVRPFVVMEPIGNAWRCMIPQAILMAAKESKKLPFQLVMRHGDVIINSRNTITLDITRAINAMDGIAQTYAPYIMLRDDSWEWVEDFTYKEGAVVTYNGTVYISLINGNLGLNPSGHPEAWNAGMDTGIDNVVLAGVEGTRIGNSIIFTEEQIDEMVEDAMALSFDDTWPDEEEIKSGLDEKYCVPVIYWEGPHD